MEEMSYQAIYNYFYYEVSPILWTAILIYIPVSFLLFLLIWKLTQYNRDKKNDRELKNQSILTQRVRDKLHYYENKIKLQRQLIKRLNSENIKLRSQKQRILNIWNGNE